jgi:hypothetical protein
MQNKFCLATVRKQKLTEHTARLYEQKKGKPEGFPLLGLYVTKWMRCCLSPRDWPSTRNRINILVFTAVAIVGPQRGRR